MSSGTSGDATNRLIDEIHACVDAILSVTRRLLDTKSAPAIGSGLERREILMLELSAKKETLKKIATPPELSAFEKDDRLRRQVIAITALDAVIAARMNSRMREIRKVLSGLWDASSAAKAYLRHARV